MRSGGVMVGRRSVRLDLHEAIENKRQCEMDW